MTLSSLRQGRRAGMGVWGNYLVSTTSAPWPVWPGVRTKKKSKFLHSCAKSSQSSFFKSAIVHNSPESLQNDLFLTIWRQHLHTYLNLVTLPLSLSYDCVGGFWVKSLWKIPAVHSSWKIKRFYNFLPSSKLSG